MSESEMNATAQRKAGLASAIVGTYSWNVGDESEPQDTIVADLLADLMHYCDLVGEDFEELVDRARFHYTAEKNGADDE
jgi:hypothetical protein